MRNRVAIYAGSFDLFTNGHLWVAEQGSKLFNKLIIAIGDNPFKKTMFTMDERLAQIRDCTQFFPNVEVTSFPKEYLARYASRVGAKWILRGIRSAEDFAFEGTFQDMSRAMQVAHKSETVFVRPPAHLASVSSSNVKGLMWYEGWEKEVANYIPAPIRDRVIAKFKEVMNANAS